MSNRWLVHPAADALLPVALRYRISANAVSIAGLVVGLGAALCYYNWSDIRLATLGLLLSVAWLVFDGLDGMVARATKTTSALGRMLDGLCDHGVFVAIYVALATSLGTREGWVLAVVAGAAHAVQSNLYEAERTRFHRRLRGEFEVARTISRMPLVRFYDWFAGALDRLADPFDRAMLSRADPHAEGERYADAAVAPMRLLTLLSANIRVAAIYVACLCDDLRYFWWFEIVPLSVIACLGIVWHRRVEAGLMKTAFSAR